MSRPKGRVVVTREGAATCRLRRTLLAAGVSFVEAPVLEKHALEIPGDLLPFSAWMPSVTTAVWTSPHAVGVLLKLAPEALPLLQPSRQVAVGDATADAVERAGWRRPEVATEAVAEGVAEWIHREVRPSDCLLWAHSADARPMVAEAARTVGAELVDWPLYAARPAALPPSAMAALRLAQPTVVTLSSAMTAHAWCTVLEGLPDTARLWPVVTIGPLTTRAALASGLHVLKEAPEARLEALGEAALEALSLVAWSE